MALSYMSPTVLGKRSHHHEDHHSSPPPDMMEGALEQSSPVAWSFKRRRALQGFVPIPAASPFGSPPPHQTEDRREFTSSLGGCGTAPHEQQAGSMHNPQVGSKRALPWGSDGQENVAVQQQQQQQQQQQHGKDLDKLREEFSVRLKEREEELKAVGQENKSLKQAYERMQGQVVTLQGENRILKKAVGIQNHKCKEQEDELARLRQVGEQALEYIRRLEQANTSLRYHLQQGGGCHEFMRPQGPPDVF